MYRYTTSVVFVFREDKEKKTFPTFTKIEEREDACLCQGSTWSEGENIMLSKSF